MRWTERQRAMLREMGIRLWPAPDDAGRDAKVPRAPEPAAGEAAASGRRPATPVSVSASADVERHVSQDALPAKAAAATAVAIEPSAAAAPMAVDALDWPELQEAVSSCTACRLCQGRRQPVFGVGHPRAHWMVVGEAPGEQEDLQGEPFVGKSGQLLDNMLRAIGLTRAEAPPQRQVYIANTIKCRPPGNRNPQPDELARCEPFLVRQVALVQPRIILAMGRFAVQSLLRTDSPIGRLRGACTTTTACR